MKGDASFLFSLVVDIHSAHSFLALLLFYIHSNILLLVHIFIIFVQFLHNQPYSGLFSQNAKCRPFGNGHCCCSESQGLVTRAYLSGFIRTLVLIQVCVLFLQWKRAVFSLECLYLNGRKAAIPGHFLKVRHVKMSFIIISLVPAVLPHYSLSLSQD